MGLKSLVKFAQSEQIRQLKEEEKECICLSCQSLMRCCGDRQCEHCDIPDVSCSVYRKDEDTVDSKGVRAQ